MSTPSSKSKPLKRLSLLQSTSSLPSPSSSSIGSPSVASHRFDLPEQQLGASSHPSPVSSVYSPTAAGRTESGAVKNSRRQSSIYYVSQDRDSDRATNAETHTPSKAHNLSTPHHESRSENAGSEAKTKRQSLVAMDEQAAPMTLVEKHADLLRFIAQKESRCLELRSQLAAEEAELQALKRKWERIVSRRVKTESFTSQSSSDAEPLAQNNVLIGLKEGVQGVGRLLAQLGDLGAQSKETNHGHASSSSISTMVTSSSTRLSQSSISSLGATSDGDPAACADFSLEPIDTGAKRHSISTPVRRRPFEPSSPGTPSPPILTPRTPQSASFAQGHSFAPKLSRSQSTTSTQTQAKHFKRRSAAAGSFPPASSIPGVSVAPLALWVEDVGKRLIGQVISVSDITSSSGKRVSAISSDISSPAATSPTGTSQNRNRISDLSALDSPSLLDDDEGMALQWAGMSTLAPDRPKHPPSPNPPSVSRRAVDGDIVGDQGSVKGSDEDGEEWNW